MSFDLAAHLGAMTRTVKDLERDGKPAKAVIASRVYDTDAADLWDALTNQQRLPRWFAKVDGDFRLGAASMSRTMRRAPSPPASPTGMSPAPGSSWAAPAGSRFP